MIRVRITEEIEASPEAVFDLLADCTKYPLWDPHILKATLLDHSPIRVGARAITVGEFRGRRIESEIYYDTYDRPVYVMGGISSGPTRGKMSCEFTPTERGTRIDWRLDVGFRGPLRLLQPLLKSAVVRNRQASVTALKSYIENGPSSPDQQAMHAPEDPRAHDAHGDATRLRSVAVRRARLHEVG